MEIDIHDRINDAYYGLMGKMMMRKTQRRIHWICSQVEGTNILDIGCSQGIVTLLLGREGKRVRGIDISTKAIDDAKYNLNQENSTELSNNIEFILANFMSYNFKNVKYDTIIIAEVLEHLINPKQFIDKASTLLNENGKLIITVPFGINDFIDHKQTFYLLEPIKLLQLDFNVQDISIMGKWLGIVSIKSDKPNISSSSLSHSIVERMEKSFYEIERSLIDEIDLSESNNKLIEDLKNKLNKEKTNFIEMKERNKTLVEELDKEKTNFIEMKERNKTLVEELDKEKTNFIEMKEKNEKLIFSQNSIKNKILIESKKYKVLEGVLNKNKTSASYQLGHLLIHETRSLKTLLSLPKKVNAIRKKSIVNKVITIKRKNILKKKVIKTENLNEIKVASIMDEFTYNSYKHECNLFQITPEHWKEECISFNPDILFVESAWKGKNDLWSTKVSNCSSELLLLIQFCNENNIKTIFWNKEDPVHFDTFISIAKLVDFVFTTDIDCVPRYKEIVGHDNVDFLPFAAQTKKHNPLEIYKRKDSFCFAGSYYLKYPERQKDFESLVNAASKVKPVDIYDRNFDNPHPHYIFPSKYIPMILGKLPFEEIDKAYKGYKFGININTIKQSQSMFARRVFELLASNTIVLSNFSRGLRLLFGDLVISTDNETEITKLLSIICNNKLYYKKFRLLGLRKVMIEHTYAERFSYIISKIENKKYTKDYPLVFIYAQVNNKKEYEIILDSFNSQIYLNKRLLIYKTSNFNNTSIQKNTTVLNDKSDCLKFLIKRDNTNSLFGIMSVNDYYGKNYIIDLSLATLYSEYNVIGKGCFYEYKEIIELNYDGGQYKKANELNIYSSLIKNNIITKDLLSSFFKGNTQIKLDNMLCIDEFNYCKNGKSCLQDDLIIVNDLELKDEGISFINKLSKISSTLEPRKKIIKNNSMLPSFSGEEIFNLFRKSTSSKIKLNLIKDKLNIIVKLGINNQAYLYFKESLPREDFNMILNSQFVLELSSTLSAIRTVFEFQDKDRKKISHSMNPAGETHSLAIPMECVYIKFGLKFVGNGIVNISKLILGANIDIPYSVIGKSKKLILTKQYPSYENIYKYGFLHSRVKAYKKEKVLVDVFQINNLPEKTYREYENIDVTIGDLELLRETLNSGEYNEVMVHVLDKNMWKILVEFIDKIKITVWVHGAEIQIWQRRKYEFERFSADEIIRQKKLSNQRVEFWVSILKKPHKNLKLIFVSNYFVKEVEKDLKLKLSKEHLNVIHNYVDNELFAYKEKNVDQRKKILSIRSFASRKYANDLSINSIIELSNRPFFEELEFLIIGDGELFDEETEKLKKYSNVKVQKRFIQHHEIAKIQLDYGVFLNPTRWDSQGVSRDEAMSSGLVAITTNVAAIPEFIDNNCGVVVEPENSAALADAIEFLYHNPDEFTKLSKAARIRVTSQCGFNNTIQQELNLMLSNK